MQRGDVREHLDGAHCRPGAAGLQHHADARRELGVVVDRVEPQHPHLPAVWTAVALAGLDVVVLPAPLGPRMAVTDPVSTVSDRPSTAVLSPYVMTRSLTSTAGAATP